MNTTAILVDKEIYNKPISDVQRPATEEVQGTRARIKLYLPPSDIPKTISPVYNESEDSLTISFEYIDTEKEKELINRDGVKLIAGFYSGKPIRIRIGNVKGIDSSRIKELITHVESIKLYVEGGRRKANLDLAEEFLKINACSFANHASL